MNAKPTPGPWKIGEDGDVFADGGAVCIAKVCGAPEGIKESKANAALIVAAVNACFAVNPDNPLAVAEALPELVEALSNLITIHQTGLVYPPLKERVESWDVARAALAKLEAKP